MRALAAACLALGFALLAPAGASARQADRLWATVNVCDTAKHPNEVGIRASMPGTPRGAGRRMRFRVQFRDGDRWRYVAGADSGWRRVRRAAGLAVESGWSFEFAPPAKPTTFRGVVRFRWVRDVGGELYVWTVDDPRRIRSLEALGVTGVITNDPRLFGAQAIEQVAAE